jgi:hypothetical protein
MPALRWWPSLADDLDIVLGAKAVKDKLDSLRLGVESKAA